MRIGELARLTGVAPSAIRYYEARDMFSPGQIIRSHSGYRDYGQAARRRLELILAGRAVGLPLEQMRTQMQDWDIMSDHERAGLLKQQRRILTNSIAELSRSVDVISNTLRELGHE